MSNIKMFKMFVDIFLINEIKTSNLKQFINTC